MMRPFVADGETAPLVQALCVQLFQGRLLRAVGLDGRSYTAGPYQTADGAKTFVLLAWPHGVEERSGDAFDVATAFVAQLPPAERDRLERALGVSSAAREVA